MKHYLVAKAYVVLLNGCRYLVPQRLILDDASPQNASEHWIYRNVISLFISVLKSLRHEPSAVRLLVQEYRFRQVLKRAQNIPWWRDHRGPGISSKASTAREILKEIAPVTRTQLLDVPPQKLACRPIHPHKDIVRRTSGTTTGTPFSWIMEKNLFAVDVNAYFIMHLENAGFSFRTHGSRRFLARYNFPIQGPTAVLARFEGRRFSIRHKEAEERHFRDMVGEINANGGYVLHVNPTELHYFVQKLKETGLRPMIHLCLAVGQKLPRQTRIMAEAYLGCPAISYYGIQEMAIIGAECAENLGLYHVLEERAIVEILDPDGNRVLDGTEGEVTVTCLDNKLMPLIRYQPGDRGKLFTTKSKTCSHKTPLLEVEGRTAEAIHLSDGTRISVQGIANLFLENPLFALVRRIQIREIAEDHLSILLEIKKGQTETAPVLETLREWLKTLREGVLRVDLVETENIPNEGNKFKLFIPRNAE